MRLIDADALIAGYKHMGYDPTEHPEESYMEGWCKGFNAAVDHCMHHVIHAPTIEERKTGKWIITCEFEDCYYAKCNQCNTTQVFYGNKSLTNFCPDCGADMRGEEHDRQM